MDNQWSGIRNYMHNMKIKWYYIILLYNEFYVISLNALKTKKQESAVVKNSEKRLLKINNYKEIWRDELSFVRLYL